MTNEQAIAAIQHLVGSPYVPSVKTYITELTQRPRIVGPGEISTREYDAQRINIAANSDGQIVSFHLG